jgi:DNA repair protein RecO (recombination protein O)
LIVNTSAIVLKSFSYGESSLIARCFSEKNGKVSLIIKGAKKNKSPKAPYFQPLCYIDIVYNHKLDRDLQILSKVNFRQYWSKILDDLYRVSLAISILELTDKTISDNDPHPLLFLTLKKVLKAFNKSLIDPKILFWFYECALLNNLGFQPNLEDPKLSGLVLPNIKNDSSCIAVLSTLLSGNMSQLQKIKVSKQTSNLISDYLWSLLDYHFEGLSSIKSFKVVKKLLS